MNLNELKDLAIGAAIKAGEFLNKSKSDEKAVYKDVGRDIKLIIDQDTEKLIRSSLQTTNIPILGEEYGGEIVKETGFTDSEFLEWFKTGRRELDRPVSLLTKLLEEIPKKARKFTKYYS